MCMFGLQECWILVLVMLLIGWLTSGQSLAFSVPRSPIYSGRELDKMICAGLYSSELHLRGQGGRWKGKLRSGFLGLQEALGGRSSQDCRREEAPLKERARASSGLMS